MSYGPKYPTKAFQQVAPGQANSIPWSNMGNAIGAPDGVGATAGFPQSVSQTESYQLTLNDFLFQVPSSIVISGARVAAAWGGRSVLTAWLTVDGSTPYNQFGNAPISPATIPDGAYLWSPDAGGALSAWNNGQPLSLSPAQVNLNSFGVMFQAGNWPSSADFTSIDAVRLSLDALVLVDDVWQEVEFQQEWHW